MQTELHKIEARRATVQSVTWQFQIPHTIYVYIAASQLDQTPISSVVVRGRYSGAPSVCQQDDKDAAKFLVFPVAVETLGNEALCFIHCTGCVDGRRQHAANMQLRDYIHLLQRQHRCRCATRECFAHKQILFSGCYDFQWKYIHALIYCILMLSVRMSVRRPSIHNMVDISTIVNGSR